MSPFGPAIPQDCHRLAFPETVDCRFPFAPHRRRLTGNPGPVSSRVPTPSSPTKVSTPALSPEQPGRESAVHLTKTLLVIAPPSVLRELPRHCLAESGYFVAAVPSLE